MRILKEEAVNIFSQVMVIQLVEYEVDTTYKVYPFDGSGGKQSTTVTKLRFKDKFVPQEDSE